MSTAFQPGILQPVPSLAIHQHLRIAPGLRAPALREALARLLALADGKQVVIGLGTGLCKRLGLSAPHELKAFAPPRGAKVAIPAGGADVWLWLRGPVNDAQGTARAELLAMQRRVAALAAPVFAVEPPIECFRHGSGRDLTGYEDGTENPAGQAARTAAFAADGSSFVALQAWQHRWPAIDAMSKRQKDHAIGRELRSNEEIDSAPESAHVKRTAQEQFKLSDGSLGFVLRRSMPYSNAEGSGLVFAAFGKSFEAFEAQLARMSGADDGVVDAIFSMSQPLATAYYWCPPKPALLGLW